MLRHRYGRGVRVGRPARIRGKGTPRSGPVLRLTELKLPLDHNEADLVVAVCKRLRLPADALKGHQLVKRSIDARKSGQIQLAYSLDL